MKFPNEMQALDGIRNELRLAASFLQIPIGLEEKFEGVIDIVEQEEVRFFGEKGIQIMKKLQK